MRKKRDLAKSLLFGFSAWMNSYQFTFAEFNGEAMPSTSFTRKLPEGDLVAVYDSEFTAPRCFYIGLSCNTWFINAGVGRQANGGSERNAPNTIDKCEDYSIGIHRQDESIERMKVASVDGGFMTVGAEATIEALVYRAADTSKRPNPNQQEYGYILYAPDANSKDWTHLGTIKFDSGGGGLMKLTLRFTIQPGDRTQAVRLSYGYAGSRYNGPCYRMEKYFDVDDLVFEVNHGAIPRPSFQYVATLQSPPPNHSKSIVAKYDSEYTVPRCFEQSSLCHSGFALIMGVGDTEQNSPNTIDSCADMTGSTSQKFESISFIFVYSVTNEIMTVGDWVSVSTGVSSPTDTSLRPMAADHKFIIHFYYKSDVESSWKYIASRFRQPGLDKGLFSVKYMLPAGKVHVVRVIHGYGPFIVGPCVRSWEYYDVDDLVFTVVESSLTFPVDIEGEQTAVYDSEFTAPRCVNVGPSCDSSLVIAGVGGTVGRVTESNAPNTIDKCEDYSIGIHRQDESIERMRVRSVEDGPLSVGKEAMFEIFVYTAADTSDRPNPHEKEVSRFWYTPDVITKDWSEIDFKRTDAESGVQLLSTRFMIQPGGNTQAVRLSYGYSDAAPAGPCYRMDKYFDVDDLVFEVNHGSVPKPSLQYIYTPQVPPPSPVTETVAKYDTKYSVPRCPDYSVACNTGFDLIWNVGDEELNFPNSIDACSDSTGPTTHKFEAVRYISVRSTEDTIMNTGDWVSIIARVYSPNDKSLRPMPEGYQFILHFYYTSDFEPRWKYITSRFRKPGDIWFEVKHMLPKGSLHAVRVIYGYGTFAVGPCVKSWDYYDVDDLMFAVKDPSSPPSTNPPTQPPTPEPTSVQLKLPSKSPSRNKLNPQSNLYVAQYDEVSKAPRCQLGSRCDSGVLLLGVGSDPRSGPEQNSPNSIDDCPGEDLTKSSVMITPIFHRDESIDKIIVHSTQEENGPMSVGMEVEAEITVYSADDTSSRSNPNKWSLAHVYYSSNAKKNGDDVTWKYLWTETVEPGMGEHVFKVRFFLKSFMDDGDSDDDDSVDFGNVSITEGGATTTDQAIRVNYGYAQYKVRSCPNDVMNPYVDVDDLVFEVLEVNDGNDPDDDDDDVKSDDTVETSSAWQYHVVLYWGLLGIIPLMM